MVAKQIVLLNSSDNRHPTVDLPYIKAIVDIVPRAVWTEFSQSPNAVSRNPYVDDVRIVPYLEKCRAITETP